MSFEEEFPSMKDAICGCNACCDGGETCNNIHKEDIKQHCLDKERVREAINNARLIIPMGVQLTKTPERVASIERIYKELGL